MTNAERTAINHMQLDAEVDVSVGGAFAHDAEAQRIAKETGGCVMKNAERCAPRRWAIGCSGPL
jgi:hypothetical protein